MPLHQDWKQVASVLPDSRAVISRNEKKLAFLGWMEEVYCANCGCPHGMVSKDMVAHIFALCDDCVGTYGVPPGLVEIPESLLKGAK